MKVSFVNQDTSLKSAFAVMTVGEGLRLGIGGRDQQLQGRGWKDSDPRTESRAQPEPDRAAWLCIIPGSELQSPSQEVKTCRSLEVSLALRRPLPGFDEAPSVAGLVINCGHAVCSCTSKSSEVLWGLSTNENSLAFL